MVNSHIGTEGPELHDEINALATPWRKNEGDHSTWG